MLGQIETEYLLGRGPPALPVHVPAAGVVAAADDAGATEDRVLLGGGRDDGQPLDVALERRGPSSGKHLGEPAIEQLVDAFGTDGAVGVQPQGRLRQALGRLAPIRYPPASQSKHE